MRRLVTCLFLLAAMPAHARDNLGVYGKWAAFRDPNIPRCYAVAMAEPSQKQRDFQPYAAIGTWPKKNERGQVHLRLSRNLAAGSRITLSVGGQQFALAGGGGDAWAVDRRMDAAIVAAMRSAREMVVNARDASGKGFSNTYQLEGAATAMDAAQIGCAAVR
ncbi:MAG: invasion associated locus B family protein [Novosphingobium sp.]